MKKKELEQIKTASVAELAKQIKDTKKELTDMHLETTVKKVKDTRKFFHLRKKLSVLLTVLNIKNKKV
ncbi:50S ribosomal protein L29 [Candidatus Gottesmanbacteria bacterium]|nr:50S ribosomal protein L29 [Candidatus Gottesmanbacteria bacterium]